MVFHTKPRWLQNFIWSILMKYFEVHNDNNHLQIDDTYMNLYMTRKIKLSQTEGVVQFQNKEVIGAIGNGTNTINGYCSNDIDKCEYKIDNINNGYIYIFATEPISSSTSGMQIFDETGKLIFDTNHRQAKVIGVGTTSGTVIGSNIAIAVGGKTIKSEKSVETQIGTTARHVPDYTSNYDPNKPGGWDYVWVYDYTVTQKVITTTTEDNVYANGGVISTKTFKIYKQDSGWKLIASGSDSASDPTGLLSQQYPPGIKQGVDKSSGIISAFSYVVIDVNGL